PAEVAPAVTPEPAVAEAAEPAPQPAPMPSPEPAAASDALVPDPEDKATPDEPARPKRRGWWSLGR
ncbi:MAG: hypothetical protein F9K34_18115, partial [Albidovulum sp.]